MFPYSVERPAALGHACQEQSRRTATRDGRARRAGGTWACRCGGQAVATVLLLGVLVAAGRWFSLSHPLHQDGAQVIAIGVLQRQLTRDPAAWVGRTLVVRARAVAKHWWLDRHSGGIATLVSLVDPAATDRTDGLPLARGPADPVLATLRWLPLLGRLAPAPQRPRWGTPAFYRVRLQTLPGSSCASCYEALLLDADPSATRSWAL